MRILPRIEFPTGKNTERCCHITDCTRPGTIAIKEDKTAKTGKMVTKYFCPEHARWIRRCDSKFWSRLKAEMSRHSTPELFDNKLPMMLSHY